MIDLSTRFLIFSATLLVCESSAIAAPLTLLNIKAISKALRIMLPPFTAEKLTLFEAIDLTHKSRITIRFVLLA
ncbi:exported hypothetical protein [Vibrio nigripulchritudo SO65]|nr:exported hypothetical protein [Vibrio nigripulchritudo AM115]CCN40537.1 exported hypothetical protein [Vibrio nigripulchritudo FTn2]CCN63663.1 exported hypothetical protein [Vibrio nigripulchritudo POn4]CCN77623.1 exported hypothetical protein [Vibrio nigripulchritudo SO65]